MWDAFCVLQDHSPQWHSCGTPGQWWPEVTQTSNKSPRLLERNMAGGGQWHEGEEREDTKKSDTLGCAKETSKSWANHTGYSQRCHLTHVCIGMAPLSHFHLLLLSEGLWCVLWASPVTYWSVCLGGYRAGRAVARPTPWCKFCPSVHGKSPQPECDFQPLQPSLYQLHLKKANFLSDSSLSDVRLDCLREILNI